MSGLLCSTLNIYLCIFNCLRIKIFNYLSIFNCLHNPKIQVSKAMSYDFIYKSFYINLMALGEKSILLSKTFIHHDQIILKKA